MIASRHRLCLQTQRLRNSINSADRTYADAQPRAVECLHPGAEGGGGEVPGEVTSHLSLPEAAGPNSHVIRAVARHVLQHPQEVGEHHWGKQRRHPQYVGEHHWGKQRRQWSEKRHPQEVGEHHWGKQRRQWSEKRHPQEVGEHHWGKQRRQWSEKRHPQYVGEQLNITGKTETQVVRETPPVNSVSVGRSQKSMNITEVKETR